MRPGITGPAVDHLRDGRGCRYGCRSRGREEVSADFQEGCFARTCHRLVTDHRTDAVTTFVRLQSKEGEFLTGAFRTARVLAHQEGPIPTTAHPSKLDRFTGGR